MTPKLLVLIVNPVVSVIFAVALLMLWRHQRQLRFVALLSASFGLKAAGYVLQFVSHEDLLVLSRLVSNLCFFVATVALCGGLISRHGIRPPYAALVAVTGVAFAVLTWFLVVQPSYAVRVVAISTGIAAACFITAGCLRRVSRKNAIERLLLLLVVLYGIAALVRQVFALLPGAPTTITSDSAYWIAVTASDLIISLMLILGIFSGIALDVFDRLRNESERDALSGLLNRRGFVERAEAFTSRAEWANVPATLILADLDRFKSVNDTHGHDAGDQAIMAFAHHLATAAGEYGVVGRLGGEEFVVLLPATLASTGRLLADGVRTSFSAAPIAGLPPAIRLTASFGVAELGRGESLQSAMRRADAALYAAKARGRDCVVVAPLAEGGMRNPLALPAA